MFNKVMNWDIILEYSPSFTYRNTTPLIAGSIQNQLSLKWNFGMSLKLGFVSLSKFNATNYIYLAPELVYELPLKYKFISTSLFLSPQILSPIGGSDGSTMTYLNTGLRIAID